MGCSLVSGGLTKGGARFDAGITTGLMGGYSERSTSGLSS